MKKPFQNYYIKSLVHGESFWYLNASEVKKELFKDGWTTSDTL